MTGNESSARLEALDVALAGMLSGPDPIADLAQQSAAYLQHARAQPALHAVMLGTASIGGNRGKEYEGSSAGRSRILSRVGTNFARAASAGRLTPGSAPIRSLRWWTIVHGYAQLESAGVLTPARGLSGVVAPLLVDLLVGEGDEPSRAVASIGPALA